jgi:hypothetical protein
MRDMIAAEIEAKVAAMPTPRDGADGRDGKPTVRDACAATSHCDR